MYTNTPMQIHAHVNTPTEATGTQFLEKVRHVFSVQWSPVICPAGDSQLLGRAILSGPKASLCNAFM